MNSHKEIVVVTGSSGLIGSAVVDRFASDYRVIGLDQLAPKHLPADAESITTDIRSYDSVSAAIQEIRQRHGDRIASVIHLAAYYDFSGEPSNLYDEITVRGTERLLHAMQKNCQVEQFIFSSTMLVHRPCELDERINEDSPIEAKWDYPQSKVDTETMLRRQHGDIPIVLLRIAGVYDDECHSIPLAHQIQRIRERWLTSQVYPGDTNLGQAFLHLDDLIEALNLTVQRRKQLAAEEVFVLGEPETLSYDELQRAFGRLIHGEEWDTKQIPKAVAKTGAWLQDHMPLMQDPFIKPWMVDLADDHYALDVSKARRLLGWQPNHSLRDTLDTMVAFLRANPLEWYRENKLKPPAELEEQASQFAEKSSHVE